MLARLLLPASQNQTAFYSAIYRWRKKVDGSSFFPGRRERSGKKRKGKVRADRGERKAAAVEEETAAGGWFGGLWKLAKRPMEKGEGFFSSSSLQPACLPLFARPRKKGAPLSFFLTFPCRCSVARMPKPKLICFWRKKERNISTYQLLEQVSSLRI